ncbi:MAG: hypothetical protein LPH21_06980 [Shewanella sp.]|nr:hypothetical protein [Shewanella sp.]
MADFTLTRGDDEDLAITVKDENRNAVPIGGATVFVTLKVGIEDPDDMAALTHDEVIIVDANSNEGKAVVTLPSAKTAMLDPIEYHMDVQLLLDGKVKTIFNDAVEVIPDVTQRTA